MRAYLIGFIGVFGLALGFQSAAAAPSLPTRIAVAPISGIVLVASHNCGKGQRWVPAGYAKHGKYRAGHCAPA